MTHGIGFLPQCDVIVVMVDGQITEVGSYTELMENDRAFAQFLQTYRGVDEKEEEDPGKFHCNCEIFIYNDLLLEHPKSPVSPISPKSPKPIFEADKKDGSKRKSLISEEKVETGRVTFSVILAYCRACTWYMSICVMLFHTISSILAIGTNFWLAEWSTAAGNLLKPNNTIQVTACDSTTSPVYVFTM